MIKFKTKVCSSERDEKLGFMSEIENEYTYYSTDGYNTCVSFSGRNLVKASAKPKGVFSKLFSANQKNSDNHTIKKTRFNIGEKTFTEPINNEKSGLDQKGNIIQTEIFHEGSMFQGMRECVCYKDGKISEVRYYSKDRNLTIEHYDVCGKIYKISKEKY